MENQLTLSSIGISPLWLSLLRLLQQSRVHASLCYIIADSHCSNIDHLVSSPISFYCLFILITFTQLVKTNYLRAHYTKGIFSKKCSRQTIFGSFHICLAGLFNFPSRYFFRYRSIIIFSFSGLKPDYSDNINNPNFNNLN